MRSRAGAALGTKRLGVVCTAIFVASLATSIALDRPGSSLVESTRVALALAERGEFADPFAPLPTGPTAHVAPAHPALVALVFRALGNTAAAHELLYWFAAVSLAAQAALLPWLARAAGLGVGAGLLGALLALLAAPTPASQWESNFVGFVMVVLTGLIVGAARGSDGDSARRDVVVALLWGGLLLAYPVAVLVYGVWLATAVHRARAASRPREGRPASIWRGPVLGVVLPLLIVTPWLIRNHQALGGFVFVRNNLGIELGVSFNSCADVSLFDNMLSGCFKRHHPNRSPAEARRVRELGELAYNRKKLEGALEYIAAEPGRSAHLVAGRVGSFWLPSPIGDPWHALTRGAHRWRSAIVYGSTVLAWVGLVMVLRRRSSWALLLTAWFVLLPLPYFVVQFSMRYRTPMMWITFLLAGVALQAAWTALRPTGSGPARRDAA